MKYISMVEMVAGPEEHKPAPCRHGNIIAGHACYCHAPTDETPRKCPIWRNFGEDDLTKWRKGTFDEQACPYFEPNAKVSDD